MCDSEQTILQQKRIFVVDLVQYAEIRRCKGSAESFQDLISRFIFQEKRNVIGNYSIDHSVVDADRCDSYLATQQGVGLWP
jgi:hypothetical protein